MPDDGFANAYRSRANVAAACASHAENRTILEICRARGGPLKARIDAATGAMTKKVKPALRRSVGSIPRDDPATTMGVQVCSTCGSQALRGERSRRRCPRRSTYVRLQSVLPRNLDAGGARR